MPHATYLEAIRQGLWRCVAFGLLAATGLALHAQKIAEVDLTREAPPAGKPDATPATCDGALNGYAHSDGFILPDGPPRKLELKVVALSPSRPALGSIVEADVTLKNIDQADIMIPWATDPNAVARPSGVTHHEYESAWFWIRIKDSSGQEEKLRLLSVPLYSSAAQPQSSLRLSPGQWVAMRIRFRLLINEERPSHSLASGPAELRIEWRQGNFTWERDGCKVTSGYSSYDTFYEQKMDPVKIEITSTQDGARRN